MTARTSKILFATLLLTLTSLLTAMPDTRNREEIPDQYKWNPSLVYPSWEAWEKDVAKIEEMIDEFAAMRGKLAEGPAYLLEASKLSDQIGMTSSKIWSYVSRHRDVDQRNNDYQARYGQLMALWGRSSPKLAWVTPEILTIPEATMEQWFEEEEGLEPYRFGIFDLYRQQEHTLDDAGEKLLSYFGSLRQSPRQIYSALVTADMVFPEVELSTGEIVTVSPGNYGKYLELADSQADRELVFAARHKQFQERRNTIAAIYNAVIQRGWATAQARGYASVVEMELSDDDIPVSVYDNLVETVRENMEPVRKFHRLRRVALGLDEYFFHDSIYPVAMSERTYPYAETLPLVLNSTRIFGEKYQEQKKGIFEQGFVDVYENDGKRSGAYSSYTYGVGPYLLLNYTGTLNNVFTTAHEAGHGMHSILAAETQPYTTYRYTIFIAEIAAILNEMLLFEDILEATEETEERLYLLETRIRDMQGTFITQTMFADYERRAHSLVESGKPITADILSQVTADLFTEYYGDSIELHPLYHYRWARIPHFFNSPYYVYQYATSFSAAAAFMETFQTKDEAERAAAVERYLSLLRSGGNDHPLAQLQKAGLDLTTKEPFLAVSREMGRLVDQYENELKALKKIEHASVE